MELIVVLYASSTKTHPEQIPVEVGHSGTVMWLRTEVVELGLNTALEVAPAPHETVLNSWRFDG